MYICMYKYIQLRYYSQESYTINNIIRLLLPELVADPFLAFIHNRPTIPPRRGWPPPRLPPFCRAAGTFAWRKKYLFLCFIQSVQVISTGKKEILREKKIIKVNDSNFFPPRPFMRGFKSFSGLESSRLLFKRNCMKGSMTPFLTQNWTRWDDNL